MGKFNEMVGFHDRVAASYVGTIAVADWDTQFTYTFQNFFHPFVGELIGKLNRDSLPGMLDATWQDGLKWNSIVSPATQPTGSFEEAWNDSIRQDSPPKKYHNYFRDLYSPTEDNLVQVKYFPKEFDVSISGPYANYNWELFFHIPLTIAVHLSKTQRFTEAQRWFHYLFDPTSNDQSVDPPKRFWKFLAFRNPDDSKRIEDIVRILSTPRSQLSPGEQTDQDALMEGYNAIRNRPFQPHAVARTRHLAYQYCVVMKYLDNLIAWGDNLFQQDTIESINEATQLYVLAANLLGERPQQIPLLGEAKAKTFAQLKKNGLGPIGDALVDLEGQFPFNLAAPNSGSKDGDGDDSNALFGIGRTLYFCIPQNDKLLGYWDIVADRLFKIRYCMNIAGVVRPLALFDPPIDPGMLVKAAAAGIDIGSIVGGLSRPVGPVRCLTIIQKALELCSEVRGLGGALLSAIEKGDAEHLALVRQRHEIQIQQMVQEVRFLQWKSAQEATTSLLTSRATALERLHYYQRLIGLPADQNAPDTITVDRRELTEENFDEAYSALVSQYDKPLTSQTFPALKIAGDTSPQQQSGASGQGRLYLSVNEDAELNQNLPTARDLGLASNVVGTIASVVTLIPEFDIKAAFWGLGAGAKVFGGSKLADELKINAQILKTISDYEKDQAFMASRTAGHERRADEWLLQYNLAAHDLMQIGRQILTSLIAEQIAHHEYLSVQQQIANAQEVDQFLHDKFTNEDLYLWMQGEISRLYYEYYRLAFDTASKAERTMKQELMRPELDAQDFVQFNYWDSGRKGLLSGEALYLDVRRMEVAYHENNKRELELTKHVSLRQLNPVALLTLKATGACQVTVPEWLYDLDCPGHYLRRIKDVALSIPSVAGPYTSVNCTLSLLKSSLRKSPIVGDDYARQGSEDDRFVDYIGAVQSIVTSSGQTDSGMFETNLRDERFLPFEGAGAESTWKLDLPNDYPSFDYATISDVILHIRYTARQGVDPTKVIGALKDQLSPDGSNLVLLFSLRHDFPTEWFAFVNSQTNADFSATIRKSYFPYFTQRRQITITGFEVYGQDVTRHHIVGDQTAWDAAAADLADKDKQGFAFTAAADPAGPTQVLTRTPDAEIFLIVRYSLS
jgi:hypothetical protein